MYDNNDDVNNKYIPQANLQITSFMTLVEAITKTTI